MPTDRRVYVVGGIRSVERRDDVIVWGRGRQRPSLQILVGTLGHESTLKVVVRADALHWPVRLPVIIVLHELDFGRTTHFSLLDCFFLPASDHVLIGRMISFPLRQQ